MKVGGGVAAVWCGGVAYLLIQAVTHFSPLHQDTAGSLNLVGECGGGDTLVTSYNPPHTSGRVEGKHRANEDLFYNKNIWRRNRHLKQVVRGILS